MKWPHGGRRPFRLESSTWRPLFVLWAAMLGPFAAAAAPPPSLQLQVWGAAGPLKINQLGAVVDAKRRPVGITRLDLLLSGFSLQRADGSWTDAKGWHAFFRAEQPGLSQAVPGATPGNYVAARFSVGVGPQANHGDPNRLAPNDPLHPVVNGLHWGWKGGYVFMALEGHWQFDNAPAGTTGGLSYHLAGDDNKVTVTLPVRLAVHQGTVLQLRLNASRLLSRIDISKDGDATHSRQQDRVVLAMKAALPQAFALEAIDRQDPAGASAKAGKLPSHPGRDAQRYPLSIGTHMPSASLPDDNPLTVSGVALGALLFQDRRLSRDGSVSCASCHRAAHAMADGGKALSTGIGGQTGTRNAMPLFNLAWAREFFWDGRAKGLREQALEPIEHPQEMAANLPKVVALLKADPGTRQRFQQAFGGPVSAQRIGLALEQYMLSLVAQDSRFDRVMKSADRFTPLEKRGFDLFLTEHDPAQGLFGADCFHCHGGSLFTNQQFLNNGLPARGNDLGREAVTGQAADRGRFKTPSLRNVAVTAPYMHDGRFQTLEEVVEHYDHGVIRSATLDPNLAKHPLRGLGLSGADKAALVAFLRTLTETSLVAPPPPPPPPGRTPPRLMGRSAQDQPTVAGR